MPDLLPPLRETIARHGIAARRSLGQNFLLDLNLTGRIARAAGRLDDANVVEIGAGIALLVGFKTRWAALLLALFTLGAAVFFHNYWGVPADQQMVQKLMFTKNLGIAGGLLAMAALGGGALGLDGRRRG